MHRKIRIMTAFLSIVAGSSGLAGCGTAPSTTAAKPINIAVIAPISGSNATVGDQTVNAAKLAVQDINAAGGIKDLGGAKINLIIKDSTGSPQGAAQAASQIFTTSHITAAIGMDLSPLTEAALPVIARYRIPMLTASIANSLTDRGNKYIFQTAPKGSQFGAMELQFVRYAEKSFHLKFRKAAVLYINNAYGQSTAQAIVAGAKSVGLKIVLDSSYPGSITDASPLVDAIKRSGAQVVFPVSYVSDAELLTTAITGAHLPVLIIGGGAGYIWPPIGQAVGSAVNGLTSVATWNWDSKNIMNSPTLSQVAQEYQKKFGTFMPEQAGPAYADVWCIADAIATAKSRNPQKVRNALAHLNVSSGGAAILQPGHVAFIIPFHL